MNKFRNTILSMILLGAISVGIFESDPSLKYQLSYYAYRWFGATMYDSKVRIDTLFIGSSRTWAAVDPRIIREAHPEDQVYNFGVNWHGRHLRYVILRDLLKVKKVKRVILEVYHLEPGAYHRFSSLVGSLQDAPLIIDALWNTKGLRFQRKLSEIWTYLLSQTVKSYYLLGRRWLLPADNFASIDRTFGYKKINNAAAERDYYEKNKSIPVKVKKFQDERSDYPMDTIERISALCQAHGAELYFLFVPGRNEALPSDRYQAQLESFAPLIVPDVAQLYRPDLWVNATHFNRKGAVLFTNMMLKSVLYNRSKPSSFESPK